MADIVGIVEAATFAVFAGAAVAGACRLVIALGPPNRSSAPPRRPGAPDLFDCAGGALICSVMTACAARPLSTAGDPVVPSAPRAACSCAPAPFVSLTRCLIFELTGVFSMPPAAFVALHADALCVPAATIVPFAAGSGWLARTALLAKAAARAADPFFPHAAKADCAVSSLARIALRSPALSRVAFSMAGFVSADSASSGVSPGSRADTPHARSIDCQFALKFSLPPTIASLPAAASRPTPAGAAPRPLLVPIPEAIRAPKWVPSPDPVPNSAPVTTVM